MDPAIYQNWQDGFYLLNASISYLRKIGAINGELSLCDRNLTGTKYIAFTELDPEKNSYQPWPVQEFFGTVKLNSKKRVRFSNLTSFSINKFKTKNARASKL